VFSTFSPRTIVINWIRKSNLFTNWRFTMKKKLLSILGLCMLVFLLAGCGGKPDEVALQLAEAINAQDLEAALALFADDAVITSVSPEPFTGKAEIQGWLEGMIADNFQLTPEILEVNENQVIERDTMTMDSMSFYGIEPLTGTSVVIVESGKIASLNFSFSDETLADMQAAPFVAPEDIIGIWTAGRYMQFNEDGTLRVADKIADLSEPVSEDHPGRSQKWTYDGMVITFQEPSTGIGEGYTGCTPDQVGVYFVRWAGEDLDRLKYEPIDDPCGTRRGGMQWGNWSPVSP
jgi:hypothetical protein